MDIVNLIKCITLMLCVVNYVLSMYMSGWEFKSLVNMGWLMAVLGWFNSVMG